MKYARQTQTALDRLDQALLALNKIIRAGKKDEALKDFVDCLRYLRMCNDGDGPDHVTLRSSEVTRVGNGGY